ncbi:MAG: hypothetical protein WCI11_18365 [Candidatus Methylumidiphilus sp.]
MSILAKDAPIELSGCKTVEEANAIYAELELRRLSPPEQPKDLSLTENKVPPIEWEREKLIKITLNVEVIRGENEPFNIVPTLEDIIKQVKKMTIEGFYGSLKPEIGIDWSITTTCPLIAECE